LNDKLIQNEILEINNLLLINVDVSASSGAFVGTVCLIAVQEFHFGLDTSYVCVSRARCVV